MAKVKGLYTFKDVLTNDFPSGLQAVNFTSDNVNFTGMEACYYEAAPTTALCYYMDDGVAYPHNGVYFFEEFQDAHGNLYEVSWYSEPNKTIDFGRTEQEVSDEFYAWLAKNTVVYKTEINITENGTTTLATAGKYCDRNIEVNVNVPTYNTELAEHKALVVSIADRTIVELINNDITEIGGDAFRTCTKLERVIVPNVTSLRASAFNTCTALKYAEFVNLTTFRGIAESSFKNCTSLEKLVIRGRQCPLQHTSAFSGSAIEAGTGFVYVPDDLVDTYKTATNWATYADQIKPISELEE